MRRAHRAVGRVARHRGRHRACRRAQGGRSHPRCALHLGRRCRRRRLSLRAGALADQGHLPLRPAHRPRQRAASWCCMASATAWCRCVSAKRLFALAREPKRMVRFPQRRPCRSRRPWRGRGGEEISWRQVSRPGMTARAPNTYDRLNSYCGGDRHVVRPLRGAIPPPAFLPAGQLCAGGAGFVSRRDRRLAAGGKTAAGQDAARRGAGGRQARRAHCHRQYRHPVRAERDARRPHHRAQERQHRPRQAAAHHAQRRMGPLHARAIGARRRRAQCADRFRLHAGSAAQQPGDPQDRSVRPSTPWCSATAITTISAAWSASSRRTGPRSRRSCRSTSAARTASAGGAIRAAISARSTARRSWTPI